MKTLYMLRGSIVLGLIFIVLSIIVLMSSPDRSNVGGEDGVLGGDFQLMSAEGEVALDDFRGQVVLLYFGFLNCPEVCPASMGIFQQSLNKLASNELEQVQPILISIDPERDSVESLSEFTNYFHPRIIGLTGSLEQIDQVTSDYGAYFKATDFKTTDMEDQAEDYVFRHSSRYYVIDQQGKLVDAMRHSTSANELVARIRTLLPPSNNLNALDDSQGDSSS